MTPEEFAKLSLQQVNRMGRGYSEHMSPAAIEKRLRIVAALWKSWQVLKHATPLASHESAHPHPNHPV